MSVRTAFFVTSPKTGQVLAQITAYGDVDDEVRSALLTMIREASAICLVEDNREAVVVERRRIETAVRK